MNNSISRRRFLSSGTVVIASAAFHGGIGPARLLAADPDPKMTASPAMRFGMITDPHYADKVPNGKRFYRDTLDKIKVAVKSLTDTAKSDKIGMGFAIELGDMVDSAAAQMTDASIATELGYLKTIEAEWAKVGAERHYVLGNHCVEALTKEEFFANTKAKPAPYSFDTKFAVGTGEVHFVVLDACFNSKGQAYGRKNSAWDDANLPESQIAWLEKDLAGTKNPTVIFSHQRLDDDTNYSVKNAAKVREIFKRTGKVLAVFQGHSHDNKMLVVEGIPYCVIRATIEGAGAENNSIAMAEVYPDYSIAIRGSFKQENYEKLAKKA